ncbi:MAG TPA: peptide ABC transporter substrate-binding protein, partial [Burkholderiaceae bacterium]|nr:peptide ABC transporter substrate-binding protein [Burkholderiaceae bacterium]
MRARLAAGVALAVVLMAGLAACNNNPYPAELVASNTLIYTFDERSPRYLDPVASYSNPESAYTYQIYEPPYGYHYLKRPYVLEARAAAEVAKPAYFDKAGQRLPDDAPADRIAESVYDIPIRKGILYQPHPVFAKDAQG